MIPLKFIFYLLVACLFFAESIKAQETLPKKAKDNLQLLMKEAYKNHPNLRSLKYQIEKIESLKKASLAFPPPEFQLSFQNVPFSTINIINDAVSNGIGIAQKIPITETLDKYKILVADIENKKIDLDVYQRKLFSLVSYAFAKIWSLSEKIKIYHKMVEIISQKIITAEKSYTSGKSQMRLILALEAEKEILQSDINIFLQMKNSAISVANVFLGRENLKQLIEPDLESMTEFYNESKTLKKDISEHLLLKKMDALIHLKKEQKNKMLHAMIPDLKIKASVMRMPRGGFVLMNDFDRIASISTQPGGDAWMYSIGVSMNLPFAPWSISGINESVEAQENEIMSIEYQKKHFKKEIQGNIQSERSKLKAINQAIKSYKTKIIPLYEKILEQEREVFLVESNSGITFLNTIRDILSRKLKLVELRKERFFILIKLNELKTIKSS